MSTQTMLMKCIEELKKEAPRKDYVLGILETLAEADVPANRTEASMKMERVVVTTAPGAAIPFQDAAEEEHDPTGDMETPEQRAVRLGNKKVPPVFLGSIDRMSLDPAKTDGKTDITPHH